MKLSAAPAWKVALLPALTAAVLTGVLLFFQQRLLDDALRERALVRSQQRADVLALQIQLALRDAVHQVRLLAHSPLMDPATPRARMRAELERVVSESPRFVWIGLAAPDGQVLAGSRGWLEGTSIARRRVFLEGRQGMVGDAHKAVALAPLLATPPAGRGDLIDVGEPVHDDRGELIGVVTAHLGLDWLRGQIELGLGDAQAMREQGLAALVLSSTDGRSLLPGVWAPEGLPAEMHGPQRLVMGDGQAYLVARSRVHRGAANDAPVLPWRTVVMESEAAALAPSSLLSEAMVGVGVAATLLLAAAGAMASRHLLATSEPVFDAAGDGTAAPTPALATLRATPGVATRDELARALHDELGQTLAALRLHWDAYGYAQAAQRERMDERIGELVAQANHQIRVVLSGLRPPPLGAMGLPGAVDNETGYRRPAAH